MTSNSSSDTSAFVGEKPIWIPVLDKYKDVLGQGPFTLSLMADWILLFSSNPSYSEHDRQRWFKAICNCVKPVLQTEFQEWVSPIILQVIELREQQLFIMREQEETNWIWLHECPVEITTGHQEFREDCTPTEIVIVPAATVASAVDTAACQLDSSA